MWTRLSWVDGPWRGRLALAPRPRGGDWLDGEVAHWHREGIGAVVSLLTPEEEADLDLRREEQVVTAQGLEFFSFPIPDREIPHSDAAMTVLIERLDQILSAGRNVMIHCRQGVGRSGLVSACLLVLKGFSPDAAVQILSDSRGVTIPETAEQRQWIDYYAGVTPGAR